jgi:SAM-dependent methyltransferase
MPQRAKTMIRLATALVVACCAFLPASLRAMDDVDVPFVTTPDNVTLEMLGLANVGADDYLIDLGSGDGRIVILAAKRFGARGLGVEIVPDLVAKSIESAKRAGVAAQAEFREQDIFKTDLAPATVVTLYLLPAVNLQLRPKLLELRPGTRVVSHDWDMGDWKPDRTVAVDAPEKKIGREKLSRLHLWIVPANVHGTWCGLDKLRGATLKLEQKFQQFDAALSHAGASQQFAGRIDGATLRSMQNAPSGPALALQGERLRIVAGGGSWSPLRGADYVRAKGNASADER